MIAAFTIQAVVLAVAMGAAIATLAKNLAVTLVAAGGCGIGVSLLGLVGSNEEWVGSLDMDFAGMLFPALVTVLSALITRLLIVVVGSGRS